jgi:capsular polysaccharide biosynthesis protein
VPVFTSPYILLENATSALAPISPKRNMTYLISLIVALVIGFGFLFLKIVFSITKSGMWKM